VIFERRTDQALAADAIERQLAVILKLKLSEVARRLSAAFGGWVDIFERECKMRQ
jgi:hypothetical protein